VKNRIAIVVAAATLLSVGASGAMAGEPQFRAPDTGGARQDRSALIGTGHAATNADVPATTRGSPALPHWSASIGTGHVSGDSAQRSQVSTHEWTLAAPVLHWTSKIGTGHAADSSAKLADEGVRLTAGK
jgi:hypothetical protein